MVVITIIIIIIIIRRIQKHHTPASLHMSSGMTGPVPWSSSPPFAPLDDV